jgi:predicted lipoprotein with Yx(FWY)xxD motif
LALGTLGALAVAPDAAGAATSEATATTISTAQNPKLGTVLVAGDNGTAIYTLKPSKTACTGKCLKVWPPVVLPPGVMSATAGPGVDASKLGTVTDAAGSLQITYAGKPLYWFVKDKTSGQVKGNIKDKWGKWAAVVTVKGKSNSGSGGSSKTNSGTGGTAF